jgi:putative transposase
MSSYRQVLYHIIFRTKDGKNTLNQANAKELYAYIAGILKTKKCHLYRINGVENHIHMLCDLNPNLALSDFMRDVKASSSLWLKQCNHFPRFSGWAGGYGAFTKSYRDKDMIINYIKNQQEHHRKVTFEDEYRRILQEGGVEIDERYFLRD